MAVYAPCASVKAGLRHEAAHLQQSCRSHIINANGEAAVANVAGTQFGQASHHNRCSLGGVVIAENLPCQ